MKTIMIWYDKYVLLYPKYLRYQLQADLRAQYENIRSFFSYKLFCRFSSQPPHFMNKNVKDIPEKWETFFVAIFSKFKIGNKFRPLKSSMGTLFLPGSSKNRSFFAFGCPLAPIWVPQQHHLSQQHFGGHVT